MDLQTMIVSVATLDEVAIAAARERQAQLAKPPGSLGRLEDLSVQLAGITGKVHNKIEKKHLLVFAADNGVVEEGVSSAPQSVTLMQTINLTRHKTGASTSIFLSDSEFVKQVSRYPYWSAPYRS